MIHFLVLDYSCYRERQDTISMKETASTYFQFPLKIKPKLSIYIKKFPTFQAVFFFHLLPNENVFAAT